MARGRFNPQMGLASMWLRADLRTRWRQHLVLLALIGLIGGVGLTCAAGARRTLSSERRFVSAQVVPDLEVQTASGDPHELEQLGRLPGVRAAGTYLPMFAGPVRKGVIPGLDVLVLAPGDRNYTRTIDRPLVLDGRLPDPARADEVVVSAGTAKRYGYAVGDRVRMRSIGMDQLDKLSSGASDIKLDGPKPIVKVVGVVRTRLDVAGASYAPNYFMASKAFGDRHQSRIASWGRLLDVRLAPGTTVRGYAAAARTAVGPKAGFTYSNDRDGLRGVQDATRVQGVALMLVGLAATVGGVVAIMQLVGRSVDSSASSRRRLVEMGASRRDVASITALSLAPAALGGALLAMGVAWAASDRFPLGAAADLEIDPGRQLDVAVTAIAVAAIVVLVLG